MRRASAPAEVDPVSPGNTRSLYSMGPGAAVRPVIEQPQPPAPVSLPGGSDVQLITLPRGENLGRPKRVTVDVKVEAYRPGLEAYAYGPRHKPPADRPRKPQRIGGRQPYLQVVLAGVR